MAKRCKVCGHIGEHHAIPDSKIAAIKEVLSNKDWLEIYRFMKDDYLKSIHSIIERVAKRNPEVAEVLAMPSGEAAGDPDWCRSVFALFINHGKGDGYADWQLLDAYTTRAVAEREGEKRDKPWKVVEFERKEKR